MTLNSRFTCRSTHIQRHFAKWAAVCVFESIISQHSAGGVRVVLAGMNFCFFERRELLLLPSFFLRAIFTNDTLRFSQQPTPKYRRCLKTFFIKHIFLFLRILLIFSKSAKFGQILNELAGNNACSIYTFAHFLKNNKIATVVAVVIAIVIVIVVVTQK